MLKTLITAAMGLMVYAAHAQSGYLIKGKLSGNHEGKKVILQYPNPAGIKGDIKDSTFVKNGSFSFTGIANITNANLTMKDLVEKKEERYMVERLARDDQFFYLENKVFSVTGPNIKQALIEGGTVQADYLVLKEQLKPLEEMMLPLTQKMVQYYTEGNIKGSEELDPKLSALAQAKNAVEYDFFNKHPDSYVSLYFLVHRGGVGNPSFETLFNKLSPRIRNSAMGSQLVAQLNVVKTVEVGKPAKDFVQNDTEGKPVSLSSFKGSYVLLDFWASWCGPCRNLHPDLIKAYQKFKGKNFEFIAVSLDDKKEPWLKAIQADGLPWIQLSDLKGLKNQAALMYGVTAIPQNFLIDPNGIIVAINLHGEELEKELGKVIK